jgi:GTP:adenosylcobinamide-phosphate guanylyltransferase
MKETNAIILAGTKNYPTFTIGKIKEHKQYLKLEEKYVLEYVIDATLQANRIKKIFIVCDPKKIKRILKKYSKKKRKRILVIENKSSLIDNITFSFKEYTQEAILLPSDAPFLRAKDIDMFVQNIKINTDYAMGFTDGRKLDSLFDKLSLYVKKERIKYGLFPIHNASVRISNLHFLNFAKVGIPELHLVDNVFTNRKLIDHKGRKNRNNWKNIGAACGQYLHERHYNPAILLGALAAIFYGLLFYLAHKSRYSKWSKVYAFPLRPSIIEWIFWFLFGCKVNIQLIVTKNIAPMLDIDLEENYLLLAKNNNFKELKKLM